MKLLIVLSIVQAILLLAEGCGNKNKKGSLSYSGSASGSGPEASWSRSWSGSASWSVGLPQKNPKPPKKLYVPKCCDPCSMLRDYKSQYFLECGQYWKEEGSKFDDLYEKCKNVKCFSGKVAALRQAKDECFKDFSVIIHFRCPAVDICTAVQGCDTEAKKAHSPAELVNLCSQKTGNYCPPEPCDECKKLTDENTMFYEHCGKDLDQSMLLSMVDKCKESKGDDKKAVLAMLYGRCRCIYTDDKHAPDPCEEK